jgi:hypothetical protein
MVLGFGPAQSTERKVQQNPVGLVFIGFFVPKMAAESGLPAVPPQPCFHRFQTCRSKNLGAPSVKSPVIHGSVPVSNMADFGLYFHLNRIRF